MPQQEIPQPCWEEVCVCVCVCVCEVAQLCPTLCDTVDCSPPGSSLHGILQARILEWIAISFSRGSSQPRDGTWVSCIAGRRFTLYSKACTETGMPKPRVSAAHQRVYQKAPSPGKAPAPSPACFMILVIWGMPLKGVVYCHVLASSGCFRHVKTNI